MYHRRAACRDRIVDGLGEHKAQYRAGNQRRRKMRGKVMMDEELSAHEIEGKVMHGPYDEEKAS